MVRATRSPLTASNGSGHQVGSVANPRSFGRVVKKYCCASEIHLRKK